jgi:hypothetical protein
MAELDPAISTIAGAAKDARAKPGHDDVNRNAVIGHDVDVETVVRRNNKLQSHND